MTERDDPAERVRRRMELADREAELTELLRRTRFTVPVWAAGVVFFLWMGWASGTLVPGATLAAFAALATGVNLVLRRRRAADLREVRRRLDGLPVPGEADDEGTGESGG